MPINNTVFHGHFRIREQSPADRNARQALIDHSIPSILPANYDGPSDTRTQAPHPFRRGAISEASGQPNTTVISRQQADAHRGLRVRRRSINQIEVILESSGGRAQTSSSPAYQSQPSLWEALADRIRLGLETENTARLQETLNAAAAAVSLQNLAASIPNHQAMEDSSRAQYRDTHRYGREGWWNAERTPARNERPATIPGSAFALPHATLNLFQSVNLFASPPPRATLFHQANGVGVLVEIYHDQLGRVFKETVAARRRGADVPKGKLFATSMELSRVRQLRSILVDEFNELYQVEIERREHEAYRRSISRNNDSRRRSAEARERSSIGHPLYLATGDESDSSVSEIGEPEGWSNLDFVFDGDYPEEVYFCVGSQEYRYPIEEVENWMMNRRGRERRACDAPIPGRDNLSENGHEAQPRHRILHTLAMPPRATSRWQNHQRNTPDWRETLPDQGFGDEDCLDDFEAFLNQELPQDLTTTDPNFYFGSEVDEDHHEFPSGGQADLHDTEYEDRGDETDDLDEEGWGDYAPQALHGVEPTGPRALGDGLMAGASGQMPIDLRSSPSTPGSQVRSRYSSDESDSISVLPWEIETSQEIPPPHPVRDWTFDHIPFMFSCRGNIFDVTRQLQSAFGFQPSLSSYSVGLRLNGEFAARHRGFLLRYLPGEEGTNMRATRRYLLHQRNSANDDTYYGTQDVVEGDLERDDYTRPPLPERPPACWNRRLDACLLLELNRGRFHFVNFWYRTPELFQDGLYTPELREFLAIRVAQVRYLGLTEAELSAAQETATRG